MDTGDQAPIISFTGEKVALGPLRRELVPLYLEWINDLEVKSRLSGDLRVMTLEDEEEWYAGNSRNPSNVNLTIYERSTMQPIGNAGLTQINHAHRTATLGIFIGEKGRWGLGYGTETVRLILDYGFTALGLHNIMLTVYSFNERAVRAYLRAGFQEIGRRREAYRLAGQVYDVIYMDCLATEFRSPVLRRILTPGA